MLILHRELDNALRDAVKVSPAAAMLVKDEQYQEPYLLEDLKHFGVDPTTITPLASTNKIVADIRRVSQENPSALLGYHYVLEGANNGNRYIAKAIAGAFQVRPGTAGTRYLDPYGDRQRELWTTFKTNLDVIELTPTTRAHAIECAKAMFTAVSEIGDEIMEKLGGSVVVMPNGPAVTVDHGHN
jgi:heme oxygenase